MQQSKESPNTSYGKMSPALTAHTAVKIFEKYSKKSHESKTEMPMFLCLCHDGESQDGANRDCSWATAIPLLGEHSMRNFGEFPKAAEGSILSEVLEENVPIKYYLTETTCKGILRRCAKRGSALPAPVADALMRQGKVTKREMQEWGIRVYEPNFTVERLTVYPLDTHLNNARLKIKRADDPVQTLSASMGEGGGNVPLLLVCLEKGNRSIVRKLTPTECAKLQGMPSWWTKDIPHGDSPEYKLWGNGMALPNILYVLEGIREE